MRYRTFSFSARFVLKTIAIGGILFSILLYMLFQGRFLLNGPEMTLDATPHTTHEGAIEIKGNAGNISSLFLNGRQIYTMDNGTFNEVLTLENGYTIMTLEAVDRYGNRERVERGIVKESRDQSRNLSVTTNPSIKHYGEEKGGGERI